MATKFLRQPITLSRPSKVASCEQLIFRDVPGPLPNRVLLPEKRLNRDPYER
jgi:hypothetical protein